MARMLGQKVMADHILLAKVCILWLLSSCQCVAHMSGLQYFEMKAYRTPSEMLKISYDLMLKFKIVWWYTHRQIMIISQKNPGNCLILTLVWASENTASSTHVPRPGTGFRRPRSTPPTYRSAPWWARPTLPSLVLVYLPRPDWGPDRHH